MRWKLTSTVGFLAARALKESSLLGRRGGRNKASAWEVAILATVGLKRVPFLILSDRPRAMRSSIRHCDAIAMLSIDVQIDQLRRDLTPDLML